MSKRKIFLLTALTVVVVVALDFALASLGDTKLYFGGFILVTFLIGGAINSKTKKGGRCG